MATRLNDIETTFHLRVSEALQGLDQIISKTKQAEKGFSSFENTLKKVGIGLAAFGAASTTFFAIAIKGALAEEQQINQLRTTVESLGDSFEDQLPGIEAFVDGLTQVTRFTDDELRPALNRAILATNSVADGMKAADLAAKVAAAGFGTLEGNVTLIARLFQGQVQAIGRLIPEFRDLDERLEAGATQAEIAGEALDRLFKIAANPPEVDSFNLMTKAIGELNDAAGKAAFEGLEPLIKVLTQAAKAAEAFVKTDFGSVLAPLVAGAGFIAGIAGAFLIFSGNVVKNAALLKDLVGKIGFVQKALKFLAVGLAGPAGLIALLIIAAGAVAAFAVVLNKASKAADDARDKLFESDRATQFKAEIVELNGAIEGLENQTTSATEAQKIFNKFGVANLEQAQQRVEVLGRVTAALDKQAKGEAALTEETKKGIAVTKESILATEKIADARLQAELDRVKAAGSLGQISGADVAQQQADIENQRIALHIETLKKLLAFEVEFGRQRVEAGLEKEREYADRIENIRGEILAAEIAAGASRVQNEAAVIQAKLQLQESSNADFIELIEARQDADIAATDAQIALGKKRESDLTELLLGQLNERTAFQRADVQQRLETLRNAGLEESKIAEDLNAQLIKIDLAAQAQRSALEASLVNQRRSEAVAIAQADRELRRTLLVEGESDIQKARLAEIDLAAEEERAHFKELLDAKLIEYDEYIAALAALDAKRHRDRAAIIDADIALEKSLTDAARAGIDGLATLSANFAVDFVSGVENAGKAAAKFFRQLIADLTRAIAKALILRLIIAATGGSGGFVGKLFSAGPFQDAHADQLARFEGSRFADLFFQGMFREFNTSQERIESALTQNRDIVRDNSKSMTAIVNEATPETTVQFTDRHVEPRVRQRANQRSSRGTLTDAERDRQIENINDRLDAFGVA